MLEQEPHLNPDKTVLENVMDGAGEASALLAEYDQVLAAWSDPDADYEKLGAKQADLESKIEAINAWTSSAPSRSPWTRPHSPGRLPSRQPLRRRDPAGCDGPSPARQARPVAP